MKRPPLPDGRGSVVWNMTVCYYPTPMALCQTFAYEKGKLHCEGVPLEEVARKQGTPCYVYSARAVRENFHSFRKAFESIHPLICYAVKANSNLSILKLLQQEGSGFDVVSGGELARLRAVAADSRKIVFSGVGKTRDELEMALEMQLFSINVESLPELHGLLDLARARKRRPRISLRMNPGVAAETHPYVATGYRQHKFGIDLNQVEELVRLLKSTDLVEPVGLGFHIGSQILDVEPFLRAFEKLKELAASFGSEGLDLDVLDLGGGLGIPYRKNEPEPDLEAYAQFLREHRGDYQIVFEPGRYIIGNAGILLNRVLYHKRNYDRDFFIVDGAMNDLLRPALYGAYHEILPLNESNSSVRADVVGPVCETGDFFARDRSLPHLKEGDYVALMTAGAYGFVAASNYNSRPRAAEVLVDGADYRIIRHRETLEDLYRHELGE